MSSARRHRVGRAARTVEQTGPPVVPEDPLHGRILDSIHEGVFEWEPISWLTLFGGAGRSIFRPEHGCLVQLADLGLEALGPLRGLGGAPALPCDRKGAFSELFMYVKGAVDGVDGVDRGNVGTVSWVL